MKVFRIVQDKHRTTDLRGTGSYRWGGRWNSRGTYMLYTSENSSLAILESLVHFDKSFAPPQLYFVELEILNDTLLFTWPDADYHADWTKLSLSENQQKGDRWMNEKKYLGIKVRSAINPHEYNFLLNPHFSRYHDVLKIVSVKVIPLDERLI